MSIWKTALALAIIVFFGIGLQSLIAQNRELDAELEVVMERLENLEEENSRLTSDIEYYEHPDNLIKEFKRHFNYKERGEELIIIVPE